MTNLSYETAVSLKKIIEEGQVLPRGYGFAYREWHRRTYVAYPFPLNHVVAAARNLWFWCRDAHFSKNEREALRRVSEKEREVERRERSLLQAIDEWNKLRERLESFALHNK